MSRQKSSSGDTGYIHPYLKNLVGQDVFKWKIVRSKGKVTVTEPYQHKL